MVLQGQSQNSIYAIKSHSAQCCLRYPLRRKRRNHLVSWVFIFLLVNVCISSSLWIMISARFERTSFCLSLPLSQNVNCLEKSIVASTFDPFLVRSQPTSIIFNHRYHEGFSNRSINAPPLIYFTDDDWEPDYNDLDFDLLDWESFRRSIGDNLEEQETKFYKSNESSVSFLEKTAQSSVPACQGMSWQFSPLSVCNIVHEVELDLRKNVYLGHGYYRDAWLIPNPIDPGETDTITSDFVLKQTRIPTDDDDEYHLPSPKSFSKTGKEAIIMERLTSSPRIVNIYGYCGLSVLSETAQDEVADLIIPPPGHINQSVIDQQPDIQSMNNFTAIEKLEIALDMSKSIADLHGFVDGVVVHGDIHPVQWLRSRVDGTLKLNDFNNAELLKLNNNRGDTSDNIFCKADRGQWGGFYRAPEEFLGEPVDEKIDVYSMGNNIYTLLTGLWPFYGFTDYGEIQQKILHFERPYIDPRYFTSDENITVNTFIERKMIQIMKLMWEHDPRKRPSIFEVVNFLSEVQRISIKIITQKEERGFT